LNDEEPLVHILMGFIHITCTAQARSPPGMAVG
jgi:hypothetical protein